MNLFDKIFYKKEFKTVMGKNGSNFWILFCVFLGAIGAIEISRSGQHYLNHMMDDPFVNWVEVEQQGDFNKFSTQMKTMQKDFCISEIEDNYYLLDYLYGTDQKKYRVSGRTIAADSKLISTLLDPDKNGAVTELTEIDPTYYGWIVTKDLMTRLGYSDSTNYPLFVNYTTLDDELRSKNWGIKMCDEDFVGINIPLLAVVDKLPNMLDFMAPQQFFFQKEDYKFSPFRLSSHSDYFKSIILVTDEENCLSIDDIRDIAAKEDIVISDVTEEDYDGCLRSATCFTITFPDEDSIAQINEYADILLEKLGEGVFRMYDYEFNPKPQTDKIAINYISFMFDDLMAVPKFAEEAKTNGVRVDMALIRSKENITTFNSLIMLMCIAILVLSVGFLCIFLGYLIDSHYKSISKNLGTIMAFGLSNRSISLLYLKIFMSLIFSALFAALFTLGSIELVCRIFEFSWEKGYYYLSMSDFFVLITAICIPLLSVVVIYLTMHFKLKASPGDLIFERI